MGPTMALLYPGSDCLLVRWSWAWRCRPETLSAGGRPPIRDEDRLPLQGLDCLAWMKPITKLARSILHTDRVPDYAAAAFLHATSGRPGPVSGQVVSAELPFNGAQRLLNFVSDDGGRTFALRRWSAPTADYRTAGGRRVGGLGRTRWHRDGAPSFDYLEFHLGPIDYPRPGAPDWVGLAPMAVLERVDAGGHGWPR